MKPLVFLESDDKRLWKSALTNQLFELEYPERLWSEIAELKNLTVIDFTRFELLICKNFKNTLRFFSANFVS